MPLPNKRHKKPLDLAQCLAIISFSALGLLSLFMAARGLWSGEIEQFTRLGDTTINATVSPQAFRLTVALWAVVGIFLVSLAVIRWYASRRT